MKYRSSIEVIEDVLGRPLFEPEFRFRTLKGIEYALREFPPPELSGAQFELIAERLSVHWDECERDPKPGAPLLMNGPALMQMHRIPWGPGDEILLPLVARRDELSRDMGLDTRRALLFSEQIVTQDPALLLDSPRNRDPQWRQTSWLSVYIHLGLFIGLLMRGS